MKTITIEELHEHTAEYVRAAASEPILIEHNGTQMAVLNPARGVDLPGKPFPARDISTMPNPTASTSDLILEDRDGR